MAAMSVNPYTGKIINRYNLYPFDRIKGLVLESRKTFPLWKSLGIEKRLALIRKTGEILGQHKKEYAEMITKEMGKPIRESIAEIEKCIWVCEYYADNAKGFLADEKMSIEGRESYVAFDPLGIVLGIMPWNFPFWQVFRFAVPALAAGNVCVLKHASNVPGCSLLIEKAFTEAGMPEGAFTSLLADSKSAMRLIDEDMVDAVSLTGSVSAGSQVAEISGRRLKKIVLELGGSDPFIVLEDADVDAAAKTAVSSRNLNGGQSCISAKRFLVSKKVQTEFQEKLLENFMKLRVGDPMKEETDIGPLAKKEFIDDMRLFIQDAITKGGVVKSVGAPSGQGFFFSPAVILDAKEDMKVMREEVFGPIAPIIGFDTVEDAIRIANSTEFGLGASLWTKDTEAAKVIARNIDSGTVVVNGMVRSDPRMPFGGIKKSGIGRELSKFGIREFTNVKSIVMMK